MTLLKYYIFLSALLLAFNGRAFSQLDVLVDGEELIYDVNYSFINIGWAKFNTEKIQGKENFYLTKAKLKSNTSLPYIDIDYDFISEIELKDGKIVPHKFTAYQYKDGKKSVLVTEFHYDSNYIKVSRTGYEGNLEADIKFATSTLFQDGLSIFYFARLNSNKDQTEEVPVIMHTDTSKMRINFSNKRTDVEISEIDYDIASAFLDGFSYFKAVFGLTGDFSGWFSHDNARIPLKAKLNVEIGSITLELVGWKRPGWSPPKF